MILDWNNGLETIWASEMDIGTSNAPGANLIKRPVDLQSSTLPLCQEHDVSTNVMPYLCVYEDKDNVFLLNQIFSWNIFQSHHPNRKLKKTWPQSFVTCRCKACIGELLSFANGVINCIAIEVKKLHMEVVSILQIHVASIKGNDINIAGSLIIQVHHDPQAGKVVSNSIT